MDYTAMVDKIITDMQTEYESAHERTTKVMNYEYFCGRLFGVYSIAEATMPVDDYVALYEYRRADRDEISLKFNRDYINPLYATVRNAS